MTIDYSVYLGPYLECEYIIVEAWGFHKVCVNIFCYRCNDVVTPVDRFCYACGEPLGSISKTIKKLSVDSWNVEDEIDCALHTVSTECIKLDKPLHFWIPNLHRGAQRKFWVNPISEQLVAEIDHEMVLSEKLWLIDAFRKEIAILQKWYKQCKIKWGLIVYAS